MKPYIFCDECGRKTPTIHRRYKGHGYCASCYARVFIKKGCSRCGGIARLPKNIPEAICRQCEVSGPCVRCGVSGKPVGKITSYGMVCSSCMPYFWPERPCEVCGKLSRRLTRVHRYGDELRRCEQCSRLDFNTCKRCRRYRKLKRIGGQGLCSLCEVEKLKNCTYCNTPMPAGRGKQCEACYWHRLLEKRIQINMTMLSSEQMQSRFASFAHWLGNNLGHHKAALSLSRHILFFQRLESNWQHIPPYALLLELFGTEALRRNKKIIQWLTDSAQVIVDSTLKDVVTEKHRIQRLRKRLPPNTKASQILNEYATELLERSTQGHIQLRTVRLSLTPAYGLLQASLEQSLELPTQKLINNYILARPGQRSTLVGFITFLKRNYQVSSRLPSKMEIKKIRREKIGSRLAILFNSEWSEVTIAEWIILALEYFHDIKGISQKKAMNPIKKLENKGMLITVNNQSYFIPIPSAFLLVNSDL